MNGKENKFGAGPQPKEKIGRTRGDTERVERVWRTFRAGGAVVSIEGDIWGGKSKTEKTWKGKDVTKILPRLEENLTNKRRSRTDGKRWK